MAKESVSAGPFQYFALVFSRPVAMDFACLVARLHAAKSSACNLLMTKLHLSVRKRDSVEFHEALRIATDVHGLSEEGQEFASRVGAVLAPHVLPWQAWETLERTILDLTKDRFATIPNTFDIDKMRGFVELSDGRKVYVHSSAFVDPHMALSIGDRVVGKVVQGRNALLLRNVRMERLVGNAATKCTSDSHDHDYWNSNID